MKAYLKIVVCLAVLAFPGLVSAQVNYLKNLFGKQNADQIAEVRDLQTDIDSLFLTTKYSQNILDLAWAMRKRGVTPEDFANFYSAFKTTVDSGHVLLLPEGQYTLSDSLIVYRPVMVQGLARGTSRAADPVTNVTTDNTGPRISVTINNGQPAIIDTTAGARFRDFALIADTSKTTGEGIRFRRPRQSTTMGNWHVDGVTIKGFKSHGIHAYGPDNNSVIMHSHIVGNGGYGARIRKSAKGGLNMMVLYNRFLENDSGAIYWSGVNNGLIMGNGLLGTQNSKPVIRFGTEYGANSFNVMVANDIEGEAGGDGTYAPIVSMNNTRGDIWVGNRIGRPEQTDADSTGSTAGAPAFEFTGQSRSTLLIQNHIVGYTPKTDTVFYAKGGNANLFLIGDHMGHHGKDVKWSGAGGFRYLDMWLDRDSLFAAIDAGSPSATFKGLYINPYGNSSVNFYSRIPAGKTGNVYFHGSRGAAIGPDTIGVISTPNGTDAFQMKALIGDLELFAATGFDVVVNEDSDADIDFRVESNNQSNMFKVDAADDAIGIGTGNPKHQISIYNAAPQLCMTDTDANTGIGGTAAASDTASILLDASSTTSPQIKVRDSVGDTIFVIATDGGIIIGSGVTGLSKGKGTINAKGVYDDGLALSDNEFAKYFGRPLKKGRNVSKPSQYRTLYETRRFVADSLHLPLMPGSKEWQSRGGKVSLGEMQTRMWKTLEQAFLHTMELYDKIDLLEKRIQRLERP